MNHNHTGEETIFADCLTCNRIKEESWVETSICETCGDDYVITEA